ncbi:uncharacterized protein Dwil_GK21050 [Drosophila willistoni]|uniref:Uncharacterized protein n=1 Tax=Drosophila willistoni TaxID=7260 RepID=B4MXC3_DROWI|nr:uncharacterized protein LOC6643040 [Drosophila willistoni]EDW76956.2 uncharacterized protein Dwil_GK21050 [Drosophila willistoni]
MSGVAVCCKCGSLPNSIPYCYGGSDYDFHCFCCAKPPKLKCIHCNAWRDVLLHEKHASCIGDKLHVFVYTTPWPPFPETEVNPEVQAAVPLSSPLIFQPPEEPVEQQQPANESDVISVVSDQEDENNNPPDEMLDIKFKPKLLSSLDYWVTVKQISQWDSCPRCGLKRQQQNGWITHAQKCAQDPKYKKRKFFIYIHTKGWCNYLVRDSAWKRHSNPETGVCKICCLARRQGKPLPYQPKPPPRPNEAKLAQMRRSAQRRSRLKKRQLFAQQNATADF